MICYYCECVKWWNSLFILDSLFSHRFFQQLFFATFTNNLHFSSFFIFLISFTHTHCRYKSGPPIKVSSYHQVYNPSLFLFFCHLPSTSLHCCNFFHWFLLLFYCLLLPQMAEMLMCSHHNAACHCYFTHPHTPAHTHTHTHLINVAAAYYLPLSLFTSLYHFHQKTKKKFTLQIFCFCDIHCFLISHLLIFYC